jgi:hypothetical protein
LKQTPESEKEVMARTIFTDANLLDGVSAAKPGRTVVVENGTISFISNRAGLRPSRAMSSSISAATR